MKKPYGFILLLTFIYCCYAGKSGPTVIASKGAVWPKPQQQNSTNDFLVLAKSFQFVLAENSANCNLLQNALTRYWAIIFQENNNIVADNNNNNELKINLTGSCNDDEYPRLEMDESYDLWINSNEMGLLAQSIWGILRGLETFSQLIYTGSDGLGLQINLTTIHDYPRYKHRGLLIDTSRHFIPLDKIYLTLDAMSFNKMNVLHWHIVDDESFPYVSSKFPELSQLGAYNPHTKVYHPDDIQNIIEYARLRGIRVLPEFDTPGHTSSWGLSHPEILTPCEIYSTSGPMDPSKNRTYEFLGDLFAEVNEVFKDEFLHLGGDEVDFSCWMADDNITKFMKESNITSYENLESYYIQRVVDMVEKLKFNSIVWEEVFSNGVKLPSETLVHVWKGDWQSTMKAVTASGKYGLLSACWYLDGLSSGGDWNDFYLCDPTDFKGTEDEQKLVLGGEACMWGEVVNEYNIISRVWPRASAVAEKLWSAYSGDSDLHEPEKRLEEHTCRMNRRGIGAQPPNGAGYCD